MDPKTPNKPPSGQKPSDAKAASQSPTFTGNVKSQLADKDGYDERAQIVFVHPLSPTIGKLLKYLNNDKTIKISEASSTQEAIQISQSVKPCILVASIQQNNDIMKLLQMTALLKADIKSGRMKTVISSTVKQPSVIKKFEDFGCHEYMIEPINDRQLQFKMSLQVKANKAARKKQKSIEVKQIGGGSKTDKQNDDDIKLKNAKGDGKGGDGSNSNNLEKNKNETTNAQVKELPPNEIAEDTWVFKNKPSKKGSKWAFRVDGPDPSEGGWQRLAENTPDGDVQWRYMPKGQDSSNPAGWHFTGEKPQFDGNGWNFESKKPNLVYKNEIGKILASKVAVDEEGNVCAAADSKVALEKIAKKEFELQKKKLEKKAAFFSRKPGQDTTDEAKSNGPSGANLKSEVGESDDADGDQDGTLETAKIASQRAYGKGGKGLDGNDDSDVDGIKKASESSEREGDDTNGYGTKVNASIKKVRRDQEVDGASDGSADDDEEEASQRSENRKRGLVEGLDFEDDDTTDKNPQAQDGKAYGTKKPGLKDQHSENNRNQERDDGSTPDESQETGDDQDADELKNRNFLKKKKAQAQGDGSVDGDDETTAEDHQSEEEGNPRGKQTNAANKQHSSLNHKNANAPDDGGNEGTNQDSKQQNSKERPGRKTEASENDDGDSNKDDDDAEELNSRNFLKKKPVPKTASDGENRGAIIQEGQKSKKRTNVRDADVSDGDSSSNNDDNNDEATSNEADVANGPDVKYFEYPLDHFGSINGTWETAGYQELGGSKTKVLVFVVPELKMKQIEDVTVLDPYWICFDNRPLYSAKQKLWIFRDKPPSEIAAFDLLAPLVQQYLLAMAAAKSNRSVEAHKQKAKSSKSGSGDSPDESEEQSSQQKSQAAKNHSKNKSGSTTKPPAPAKTAAATSSESKGDLEFEAETENSEGQDDNKNQDDSAWQEEPSADSTESSDGSIFDEEKNAEDIDLHSDDAAADGSNGSSDDKGGDGSDSSEATNATEDLQLNLDKAANETNNLNLGIDRVEPLVFLLRMAEMQMSQNETIESSFKLFFDMMNLAFNFGSLTVVGILPSGQSEVFASRKGLVPGSPCDLKSRSLTALPHIDGDIRTEAGLKRVKAFCCPVFEGPVLLGLVLIEKVDIEPDSLAKDLRYLKVVCRSLKGMLLTLRCKLEVSRAA